MYSPILSIAEPISLPRWKLGGGEIGAGEIALAWLTKERLVLLYFPTMQVQEGRCSCLTSNPLQHQWTCFQWTHSYTAQGNAKCKRVERYISFGVSGKRITFRSLCEAPFTFCASCHTKLRLWCCWSVAQCLEIGQGSVKLVQQFSVWSNYLSGVALCLLV